jgi:hypothetical protein
MDSIIEYVVEPQYESRIPLVGLMSIIKHVILVINISNCRSQGGGVGSKVGIYVYNCSLHAF